MFTPQAIAALRQAQTDAMPQTARVLVRSTTADPGAVVRQGWALARAFPCRIMPQTAEERTDDSRRAGINTATLSYPHTEPPLDGSEVVIVDGDAAFGETPFTRVFRVLSTQGEKSYDVRRVAELTTHDVPDINPANFPIP